MHYLGLLAIFALMYLVCLELERGCGAIAHRLRIPESIAGATLLAVSSSTPEFFTAFLGAVLFGKFEIGLMAILWSAIFNITIIPGVSALSSKKRLIVVPAVVSRDCVSYLAIALLLLALLSDGVLDRSDAFILLGAYGLYVYVLLLMLKSKEEVEAVEASWLRIVLGVGGGILAIGLLCHGMIWLGEQIALAWVIPIALVSAFIFAPGTSIPDLLLSVIAARRGAGSAAIANAYGSNSFNLTICLAAPVLYLGEVRIDMGGGSLISIWMLIGSVLLSMIFVRTGYELTKREGVTLIVLFIAMAGGLIAYTVTQGA